MNQELLFSVLIANYNNGNFIKEAIESVFMQTYGNWEMIIVDDASTDNSVELIQGYRDERIKLFRNEENKGCGFTKALAAQKATGSIMGFLDPDDILSKDAVEVMVATHKKFPGICLASSSHYICDYNLNIVREAYAALTIPDTKSYLTYGKGITAFASFKKEFYQKTEGINPKFRRAVDQDLYYKLEEVGDVMFVNRLLYYYRIHNGGISTGTNISKSRYWLVKAKEAAYQRRLVNNSIDNIDQKELKSWWSILYATKASDAIRKMEFCKVCYWITFMVVTRPFDKYFAFKIKTLFLNTYIHRWLKRNK